LDARARVHTHTHIYKFLKEQEINQLNAYKSNSILKSINSIESKTQQIEFLQENIKVKRIENQLNQEILLQRIQSFENIIKSEVCNDLPTTFWHTKKHTVNLSYVKDFDMIHTHTHICLNISYDIYVMSLSYIIFD
jgi:hypothetical protein